MTGARVRCSYLVSRPGSRTWARSDARELRTQTAVQRECAQLHLRRHEQGDDSGGEPTAAKVTRQQRRAQDHEQDERRRRLRMGGWSGRRGSNPRHPAWKAGALPLSYSRTMSSSEGLRDRNWSTAALGSGPFPNRSRRSTKDISIGEFAGNSKELRAAPKGADRASLLPMRPSPSCPTLSPPHVRNRRGPKPEHEDGRQATRAGPT